MIDLPDKLLLNQLNSQLKRGKILKTQLTFGNKTLFKRLIILNIDFRGDDIFYILTTSQVEWYKKYCSCDPIKGNFIYVNAGQTSINPKKDMVIDCRSIDIIKREYLFENYKYRKLRFLGNMPDTLLEKIDNIILNSILISQKIKKYVLK